MLAPLVPRGTELDDWQGRDFASIVAFRFLDTCLFRCPVPLHRDFEEVNLRFYVRRAVGSEVRRAVVFVREIVPRAAVAATARVLYNEPYIALPMRSRTGTDPLDVQVEWKRSGRWEGVQARAGGPPTLPAEGSQEGFIAEHYWGYTRQRDGSTVEYQVAHPRWAVGQATSWSVNADLGDLYGPAFAPFLGKPVSVYLADGSPISVSFPRRL